MTFDKVMIKTKEELIADGWRVTDDGDLDFYSCYVPTEMFAYLGRKMIIHEFLDYESSADPRTGRRFTALSGGGWTFWECMIKKEVTFMEEVYSEF